ncbi:hypothetical protein GS982_32070 [Rhodococcus hoagii]|uniref:Uncharacterized protein n=1 Tax=Rhodococcus hoagii TaxID=43767 RepID=A0A9Q4ZIL0_RHOHA|nr:hypothetical protein [Prescottella equi]NKT77314.1 hypothetical protein [Prescottella equi]NKZ81101.1 hypothetical protein [Prescottella equi]NKZ86573.1 hypothetical protein [Prescottella equi]NKZ86577.1 hypothetical protein [Prescottella equi]
MPLLCSRCGSKTTFINLDQHCCDCMDELDDSADRDYDRHADMAFDLL